MGTKMGAAGVRIELKDSSAYSIVEDPKTVAGIVGFASKGELNKIITLANTAEQDTKIGYGFQSYKYNQGLYAARAVLNAGGYVEFIRPYGETIDKSDPRKRDLKTDAYVVTFDKNAYRYTSYPKNSFNIKHFASTRYKTDGAAEYGVTRKINNISETIAEGTNVNFNVNASETFSESDKCRWYDDNRKLQPTDTVLFAMMNSDPSNSYRAYTRYDIVSCEYEKKTAVSGTNPKITCTLSTFPGFIVGDRVRLPITDGGTSSRSAEALVTGIVDKTVNLEVLDAKFMANGVNKPNAIIYCDHENAVADGYDYMNVRTAVAGNSVKTFASMHWGSNGAYNPATSIKNGQMIEFLDSYKEPYYLRFVNKSNTCYTHMKSGSIVKVDEITGNWIFKSLMETSSLLVGDTLRIYYTVEVDEETTKELYCVVEILDVKGSEVTTTAGKIESTTLLTNAAKIVVDEFSENYDVYKVDISSAETWEDVANAVVEVLRNANIGYGNGIIANDIDESSFGHTGNVVWVKPSAAYDYSIGDKVAIVRGKNVLSYGEKTERTGDDKMVAIDTTNVVMVTTITDINALSGKITLLNDVPENCQTEVTYNDVNHPLTYQLVDLSLSAYVVYNAVTSQSYVQVVEGTDVNIEKDGYRYEEDGQFTALQSKGIASQASVGDVITFTYEGLSPDGSTRVPMRDVGFTISTIDTASGWMTGLTVKNLPKPNPDRPYFAKAYECSVDTVHYRDVVDTYIISNYSLYVGKEDQKKVMCDDVDDDIDVIIKACDGNDVKVEESPKVLADSDIGATFLGLGLATTQYLDIDFNGNPRQVYVLNSDGENISRMFLAVSYKFNGQLYEFEGTIVPYTYNNTQLFIGDAADSELTNSGATFVLNESGILDYFLENDSYDLSQSMVEGVLNGSVTCIAYNDDDPAIQNDAVWSYNPNNNRSGSTLSTAWNLYLDKDGSDVSMLVAAGVGINNLFMKNLETLNTQVMQAMLNVCELRKDCFAIMDGVGEAKLDTALKKNILATGFGSTLGRWGAIYDGRSIFYDSIYTNGNVEGVKSIQLASLITSNRSGSIWWLPPAGKTTGVVPSAWGTREKYPRRFSYPEDRTSDIAKLSDIHCNPTRSTSDGMYIWGDFTMQMEDTAFNQIHVSMLMAGVHKSFYKYLDDKVFRLNTAALRLQITSDLQARLNSIMTSNPAGFYSAVVICDDSNNPPEVIDQNKLYVDLKVRPTKSTRYIYLRSEVLATSDGNQITTTLS